MIDPQSFNALDMYDYHCTCSLNSKRFRRQCPISRNFFCILAIRKLECEQTLTLLCGQNVYKNTCYTGYSTVLYK